MNTKLYEAPLMELLSVEVTSSFATSEDVSTSNSGLGELNAVDADWD